MNENEVIRRFRAEDLEAVLEIEKGSFPDPWPKRLFMDLSLSSGVHFYVTVLKGKTVGYVVGRAGLSFRRTSTRLIQRFGHVLNIAVTRELRRCGLGTRLMQALEDAFRRDGLGTVRLEVRASNLDAQRFYEKLGYSAIDTVPLYYGDEDAVVMEKLLG